MGSPKRNRQGGCVFIHIGGALVFCFVVYLLVVSPGFRVFGAIVLLGGLLLIVIASSNSGTHAPAPPSITAEQLAVQQAAYRSQQEAVARKEASRWTKINSSEILITGTMSQGCAYSYNSTCTDTISFTIKNRSRFAMTALDLSFVLYDCPAKHEQNFSDCDVVGKDRRTVTGLVPAEQVRQFGTPVNFPNTPPAPQSWQRLWHFSVMRIQSEEADS
jgi:hypothetical protein